MRSRLTVLVGCCVVAVFVAPRSALADESPAQTAEVGLGPDGRTRPVPALIAGGTVLSLLGAAGLVASALALLQTPSDDTPAVAGEAVGLGLSFVALGGGTAMVIIGSPRPFSVASADTPGPHLGGVGGSFRWTF